MATLEQALIQMGLGLSVLDNAERSFDAATPDNPKVVRFITVPERALALRDVGALSWQRCHAVAVPLNGPRPERIEMRPVVRGVLYDLRFLCRTKTAPKAADVRASILERCGFEVDALCLLKQGIRIQGHPNADVSQWYARARWMKGDSVLTDVDPIIVEEIVRIQEPEAPIDETVETTQARDNSAETA